MAALPSAFAWRRHVSLRTVSIVSTAVLTVFALAVASFVIVALNRVERAATRAERLARAVDFSEDAERSVREVQRLGNLWVATRSPELERERAVARADVQASLAKLTAMRRDVNEAEAVASLQEQFRLYDVVRAEMERRGRPLSEVIRETRPLLERFLSTCSSMRGRYELELRRADRQLAVGVRRLEGAAIGVALSFSALLVLAGLGTARCVLGPIFALSGAVSRFRRGEEEVRAPPARLREVDDLARGFNDLAQTITRQRRDQLAYLAGVAHDLKNPLTSLKLGLQSLERAAAGQADAERTRRLVRPLDRLARMVDDLLEGTRIEAGQLELHTEEVDLRGPAGTIVDLYAATTERHQVSLAGGDEPLLVQGDPLRLEQVISNLVSNAIKYSPDGGPVEVRLRRRGDEVEVAVSDRGVGIPASDLDDVFLPFRRRRETIELAPGAGLGLSIVRRIVRAHGGRIDVESTPGVGSTFRVLLPARPAAPDSSG